MPLDNEARARAGATKRQRTIDAIESAVYDLLVSATGEVTYKQVAREAKVSEATVYRYYPTKRDLLDAAIKFMIEQHTAPDADRRDHARWLALDFVNVVVESAPDALTAYRQVIGALLESGEVTRDEVGRWLLDGLLEPHWDEVLPG